MTKLTKNQAKRKRTGGKNKTQVPWVTANVANDLDDYLKKQNRLKKSNRRQKRISKFAEKLEKENTDEETPDIVPQGKEG